MVSHGNVSVHWALLVAAVVDIVLNVDNVLGILGVLFQQGGDDVSDKLVSGGC